MSHLRIPQSSIEYLKVRVRVDEDATDPSVDFTPSYAFTAKDAAPADTDWQAAAWAAGGPLNLTTYALVAAKVSGT